MDVRGTSTLLVRVSFLEDVKGVNLNSISLDTPLTYEAVSTRVISD